MTYTHPIPTLPRARALTDLLLSDGPRPAVLDAELRRAIGARAAAAAPGRPLGTLRLDGYTVRCAVHGDNLEAKRPFVWSARATRRILGVAAARRLASGNALNPTEAVITEVDLIVERGCLQPSRPRSLALFLTEAPVGVRAQVIAEAVVYATDLLGALEWQRLGSQAQLGGGDPIWAVPGAPWVSLRGRRDAEILVDPATGRRALFCIRTGRPRPDSGDDLALVALASALRSPELAAPTRIVSLWPESGRSISLEVDRSTLQRAARQLIAAVGAYRRSAPRAVAA